MAGKPRLNSTSVATRYTQTVTTFGGLDLADHRLQAPVGKAIAEENYYFDGRFLRKRQGYEQIGEAPTFQYVAIPFSDNLSGEVDTQAKYPDLPRKNAGKVVHGLWEFTDTYGKSHGIAHIGTLLYTLESDGAGGVDIYPIGVPSSTEDATYACWEYVDKPCQAYASNGILWFLGGTKYVAIKGTAEGRIDVEPVEDSELAYIPTTTISVGYANAKASKPETLDAVNLLTRWRKNTLLSGVGKDESATVSTDWFVYTLDSALIPCAGINRDERGNAIVPDNAGDPEYYEFERMMSEIRLDVLERGELI